MAALKNMNPLAASLAGWDEPTRQVPASEKAAKLLGPIGFKYHETTPAAVGNLKSLYRTLSEARIDRTLEARHIGEKPQKVAMMGELTKALTDVNDLERRFHQPGLKASTREQIRTVQEQIAQKALTRWRVWKDQVRPRSFSDSRYSRSTSHSVRNDPDPTAQIGSIPGMVSVTIQCCLPAS